MIRGLYTAAAGLATAALRLGVASNNVANASTPGYKQDRLPEEVGKALDLRKMATDSNGRAIGSITLGPTSGLAELDLSGGPLQETGNALDVAIGGRGFFAVSGPDGAVRYTRDGGFTVDSEGMLRSRSGFAVLDQDGQPIQAGQGPVELGTDGTLTVNGEEAGRLMIVDFAPEQTLRKEGSGMFSIDGDGQPLPATDVQLYQGYLEGSNVDLTESMVAVMGLVRAYEANQRLLMAQDESLSRAVNEIGKV
jgi:flagellar basal-body rod protein FlgF